MYGGIYIEYVPILRVCGHTHFYILVLSYNHNIFLYIVDKTHWVFYLYAIMNVSDYLCATKKFTRTCIPAHELFFTYVLFRPPAVRR